MEAHFGEPTRLRMDDKLFPCQTDRAPAPKQILEVIWCKCKTGCSSKRCTWRKHGLLCSAACGECRGVGCENGQQPEPDDNEDEL